MIVELELDLDYEQGRKSPTYHKWLDHADVADTPENYVIWGIVVLFWAKGISAKVIRVTLESER